MAYQKQRSLKFGKNAKHSGWGRKGMARGMYSGGYTRYVYGIKGLFTYIFLESWGDFYNMKID